MKTICILFAACTIISLPAYSWDYTGNYENIPPEDEDSTVQTPAIIETVKVGGFTLDMDRVETGFYIPRQAQGNFLGEFRGDGFDIRGSFGLFDRWCELSESGRTVDFYPVAARDLYFHENARITQQFSRSESGSHEPDHQSTQSAPVPTQCHRRAST